jgi:hypothetical protein
MLNSKQESMMSEKRRRRITDSEFKPVFSRSQKYLSLSFQAIYFSSPKNSSKKNPKSQAKAVQDRMPYSQYKYPMAPLSETDMQDLAKQSGATGEEVDVVLELKKV